MNYSSKSINFIFLTILCTPYFFGMQKEKGKERFIAPQQRQPTSQQSQSMSHVLSLEQMALNNLEKMITPDNVEGFISYLESTETDIPEKIRTIYGNKYVDWEKSHLATIEGIKGYPPLAIYKNLVAMFDRFNGEKILIYDLDSAKLLHQLSSTMKSSLNSVRLLFINENLIVSSNRRDINVWDINSNEIIHSFTIEKSTINDVTLTSDKNSLISVHKGDEIVRDIICWDLKTGKYTILTKQYSYISKIYVVSDYLINRYGKFNLSSGEYIPFPRVLDWDMLVDKDQIIIASDTEISNYDLDGNLIFIVPYGKRECRKSMQLTLDKKVVTSLSDLCGKYTIEIWDIEKGTCLKSYNMMISFGEEYSTSITENNVILILASTNNYRFKKLQCIIPGQLTWQEILRKIAEKNSKKKVV